ncbi:MAG: DUF2062 domain-containing protein [Hyphomicrobiaceae bacterium]|nr:DUF2062 domain-containing protein [Hyphomicrobiaceae bacterium]
MLFKRREHVRVSERLRVWLWPRRSWARSLRYVRLRIVRQRTSPHAIALGCAVGVFVSCTPLIGGQMVLAAILGLMLRASVPAAMLATFFGNPISWPVIWAATYAAGARMIGSGDPGGVADITAISDHVGLLWQAVLGQSPEMLAAAGALAWPFMKPMLAGSLPVGLLVGALIYYMMRATARAAQARRRPADEGIRAGLQQEFAESDVEPAPITSVHP